MAQSVRSALIGAVLAMAALGPVLAEEPLDTLTVLPFPAPSPTRVLINDFAFNHMVDGKLHIVDGKTGVYQGVVPLGFIGIETLSPDGKNLYITTSYYDRGTHGNKVELVEIYDMASLKLLGEIQLPQKRAQAIPYRPLTAIIGKGRYLLVQNATPASSVTVVDLEAKKPVSEIDTAGCWGVFPVASKSDAFATVCGDGTLETVVLGADAKQASRGKSEVLFDAQNHPIFIQGSAIGDTWYFVTFDGDLVAIDVSGPAAKLVDRWSFVQGVDGGWRPGGYNLLAAHAKSGRIYVGMHPDGVEGSHKTPAAEIWALDPKAKKVLTRAPGHNALGLTINQEGEPLLFAIGEGMNLLALDPAKDLAVVNEMKAVAENSVLIDAR